MADHDDLKLLDPREKERDDASRDFLASRREFLGLALAASTGAILWPIFSEAQQQGVVCAGKTDMDLAKLGEIHSVDGYLRGVIDLKVDTRQVTYYNANPTGAAQANYNGGYLCYKPTLRTYVGYQGHNVDPANRVTPLGVTAPGPVLKAKVGDKIELIFLNRINRGDFNRTSVTSVAGDCDTTTSLSGNNPAFGPGSKPYPGNDKGNFPNCFHAGNTSNLHFHGTHTTPSTFGDNVLIGVIPDPDMDPKKSIDASVAAYNKWQSGGDPTPDLIDAAMKRLNEMHDAATKAGNTEQATQLADAIKTNETNLHHGEFPQYWPGVFPHFFDLPIWSGNLKQFPRMGQSPGTHWYHCHQHGSTTAQLLNGMAGLFVITGDYDEKIKAVGYKEQFLILQLFAEQPNQVNALPSGATMAVNGQVMPKVTMKKGEIQWWRMANASMKSHGTSTFLFLNETQWKDLVANPSKMTDPITKKSVPPPKIDPSKTPVPVLSQTAQDGVQFDWTNFTRAMNQTSSEQAPGNRADFLVTAPTTPGNYYLVWWPPAGGPPSIKDIRGNTVLKVVVAGDPTGVPTALPTQAQYPEQPKYLADVTEDEVNGRYNRVTFSMTGGPGTQPMFYIDGQQFQEGRVDQLVLLETAEEWTLINSSTGGISHPFHIHINPFQVTEVFDPATMTAPQKLEPPYVWWDVIPIPAGIVKPNTTAVTSGYVKMRSRFVDFPGKYVLHCHILGHEDRGMMQLVQVFDNKTVVKHH